jgi:hypothetical protein
MTRNKIELPTRGFSILDALQNLFLTSNAWMNCTEQWHPQSVGTGNQGPNHALGQKNTEPNAAWFAGGQLLRDEFYEYKSA